MDSEKMFDLTAELDALGKAQAGLYAIREQVDSLRRDENALLNHINNQQRKIESALLDVRKNAPRGTDWAAVSIRNGVE